MKKYLLLIAVCFLTICNRANAQATPGPVQQKLIDSLCNSLSKIDIKAIHTKKEANDAFMDCFTAYADMLLDVAKEQNIEVTDDEGMHQLGTDIGKNLMKQKCGSFMQLAVKMAKDDDVAAPVVTAISGSFKRIDVKDFNYIVITDKSGSEKSFLWLREFPGSDKFMAPAALKLAGKKLNIKYQEIEVYLPKAKGYYKVKEITGIDIQ